jgi:hypothetical protein
MAASELRSANRMPKMGPRLDGEIPANDPHSELFGTRDEKTPEYDTPSASGIPKGLDPLVWWNWCASDDSEWPWPNEDVPPPSTSDPGVAVKEFHEYLERKPSSSTGEVK